MSTPRKPKKIAEAKKVNLSIESLKKAGAFTGRPIEKEIKWTQNGEDFTATVFVRPLGYQSAVSDLMAATGKQDGLAGRIAASICDEEGKPVFKAEDITGEADGDRGALDGALTYALLAAITEVNNLGKTTS